LRKAKDSICSVAATILRIRLFFNDERVVLITPRGVLKSRYYELGINHSNASPLRGKRHKRIILISFQNLELLQGRSSSPVGYGIGIAEVVGSNPTRSTFSCCTTTVLFRVQFLMIVGQIQQQRSFTNSK
jgi:hypothetical protein